MNLFSFLQYNIFTSSQLFLWIYLPYFLLAVFLAFFIPGDVFISKLRLTFLQRIVLSITLGIVLWGFQGFIFGYLGIRWFSYLYLLLFFILWLKIININKFSPSFNFKIKNIDFIILVTIILGVVTQVSILAFMGFRYPDGLSFCCGAVGDFIYHLGLTYQVIQRIPPYEYDLHGVYLSNYHYWGNLVVAELVRIFHLPLMFTQFQYFGVILSTFLGLLAITFCQINNLHKNITRWLVFFLYFSGDFIYVLLFFLGKGFNLAMKPLESGALFLNNPPRAFSIIIFFAGLSLFSLWIKKRDFYTGLLMAIVFSSLIAFKANVGIFALSGLATVGIYFFIKKYKKMILPILISIILSLIIYLPVNKNSGGLFFTGFWRFEDFIVQPTLGLSHLELARRIYLEHRSWLRVLQYEIIFVLIFVFSIFGSKIIGLFQTKKSLSFLSKEMNIFLITGIIVSFIAGSFFWQKSGGSNSFNFLVSVYVFGSIYAAIACFNLFSKINNHFLKLMLIFVLVGLNLPRTFDQVYMTMSKLLNNKIDLIRNDQLEAMQYIKENTKNDAIFLINPRNTSFYSFIGERGIFLGDYGLLGSHDVDTSDRQKIVKEIFYGTDSNQIKKLLSQNKINYLYLPSGSTLVSTAAADFFTPVFDNKSIKILKFIN